MTHDDARALLAKYALGALDLATAAELRRHIAAGCGECLHELFEGRRALRPALPQPVTLTGEAASSVRTERPAVRADRHPALTRPPGSRAATTLHRPEPPSVARAFRPIALAAALGVLSVVTGRVIVTGARSWLGPPTGLGDRVAALEGERADLGRRLAKLTRALVAARATGPPSLSPSVPPGEPVAPTSDGSTADTGSNAAERESGVAPHDDDVAPRATAPPTMFVRYADGALSVRIVNASVADVLREIGRQSGVIVRARVADPRTVNVAFDDVPFRQALRRLLGVENFFLTYDGLRPRMLEVLQTPDATSPVATAATGASDAASQVAPRSLAAVLDEHPAVSLSDRLGKALGTPTMPLRRLLDTGINHVDPTIRSTAIREAVDALQTDVNLRGAMFGSRPGMDGGIFGALVDGMDVARAQEMLFYVAIAAQDSDVRNGAATLIQRVASANPR